MTKPKAGGAELSPGTPASAESSEKKIAAKAPARRKRCDKFGDLPDDLKKAARQMLVEGATFEDVAEAVKASRKAAITERAIEIYFRSNLDVQEERIAHQVKTAKALKAALRKPHSSHAALAEAVLITGLMGMSRREASARVQQALRISEQEANLKLKKKTLDLRTEKLALDKRVLSARLAAEEAKQELVKAKLNHLRQAVEKKGDGKALGPEIIRQIHEIYGIVSVPQPGREDEEHGEA